MTAKNILLLFGGGGSEHEVSIRSAKFFEQHLKQKNYLVTSVEITKTGPWQLQDGSPCELRFDHHLHFSDKKIKIDYAIACIHGYPGETGDIQSYFEIIKMPYFGAGPEANRLCFNKIMTKLWLEKLHVPVVEYLFFSQWTKSEQNKALAFFEKHQQVYVKASNQGSSVGCYQVEDRSQLNESVEQAFTFSPFVLLEKRVIRPRELEVAAYTYKQKICFSHPGEILVPSDGRFYTYEEKYSTSSHTQTSAKASDLEVETITQIKDICLVTWNAFKLRHLSRIDFFLVDKKVYLNEVNTFPGATPSSLFPKMIEADGVNFSDYLDDCIKPSC